ncbi:MAG: FGGY-family carbohydrate kinase [Treponema sp.]|nr:FGGY-family carbohydrate kinase [Treponema sp.]
MAGIILTVDIGTSSLKAAFIDLDGRLLAFSRQAYRPDAGREPGAGDWELAFARALEGLYARAPDCVPCGVCVSGNGPTLVPVTGAGEPLQPLYWHDGRTALPAEGPPPRSFFLPRAAWLKKNAPAEYEKTSLFFSPHEWLALRLGAEALTVLPSAAYEPYYWDDEQCRYFDLDREKFPPFVSMGSVMGSVSAKAASFFGPSRGGRLKSGIPIVAAGPDFITALIGTGTLRPGDVCDRAGSSEGINVCAPYPVEGEGLRALPHAREGLWNIGSLIPSSGRLFERYRAFTGQEALSYEEHLAALIPQTARVDVFRRLQAFPLSGDAFPCPPLTSSPLDLGRAVLCAIGFAVRGAAEALGKHGFAVREMRVSGGQAKNPLWNQLKADITGITVMVPEIPDGELAGNAVLSATALGVARAFEEAADKMVRLREIYKPRTQTASFWDEQYWLHRSQKRESAR